MRLFALVVVCGLMVVNDGGSVRAARPGFDFAQRILPKGGQPKYILTKDLVIFYF